MKLLYPLIIIYTGLTLSGCAYINGRSIPPTSAKTTTKTAAKQNDTQLTKKKDISAISLNTTPTQPYTILGKEIVSQFNIVGNRRSEGIIQDKMRNLAAELGGDAVINIKRNDNTIQGTIIAFDDKTA